MIGISIHPMLHFIPHKYEFFFYNVIIFYHINQLFSTLFTNRFHLFSTHSFIFENHHIYQ